MQACYSTAAGTLAKFQPLAIGWISAAKMCSVIVELGMLLGFDWKMKLGFGGFSDGDLKNENGGRRAEV